jgi:hypothetical protein
VRKEADKLACEAWTKRMLAFKGPAQPSQTLGDALNAGCLYLEVKCLGCNTHQTAALDIVRRPKTTPIHELERYMCCKCCSELRGYPYKRSHRVALRRTKFRRVIRRQLGENGKSKRSAFTDPRNVARDRRHHRQPIHPKAMPVPLTTDELRDVWNWSRASGLRRIVSSP